MFGDEEETHELEHLAIAVAAVVRMQKQRPDLARPVVLFDELEDRHFLADVDDLRFEQRRFDVIAVERLKPADFRDDAARADHCAWLRRKVLHDEQVTLAAGTLGEALEARPRLKDALG